MVYLIVAVLVAAADQAVKVLVRSSMVPGDSISVIGDLFRITYINNTGVSFGMFAGGSRLLLIFPAAVILCVMLFVLLHRNTHPLVKYALSLVVGGGFGNLIDRTLFGQVTDMFSISFFPPIFNVADIAVTVGCVLIIIYALFGESFSREGASGQKKKRQPSKHSR